MTGRARATACNIGGNDATGTNNPDTPAMDEGNGDNTVSKARIYPNALAQKTAGLRKRVFGFGRANVEASIHLQAGLNPDTQFSVAGYPAGSNPVTKLPWAPATDGLRNITGRVNGDGTVSVWAITSNVGGNGDQGADPNKLVVITDTLSATSPLPERASRRCEPPDWARRCAAFRSRRGRHSHGGRSAI